MSVGFWKRWERKDLAAAISTDVLENAKLHCISPKCVQLSPRNENFRETKMQKKTCNSHTERLLELWLWSWGLKHEVRKAGLLERQDRVRDLTLAVVADSFQPSFKATVSQRNDKVKIRL